jgi:hypothetical protein
MLKSQTREPSPIDTALDVAILTQRAAWDETLRGKIAALRRFG